MARPLPRSSLRLLFLPLLICALAAACGSSPDNSTFVEHGADAGGDGAAHDSGMLLGDGSIINGDGSGSSSGGGDSSAGFDVEPSTLQTVTVTLGQPIPTVVFEATDQGQPVTA